MASRGRILTEEEIQRFIDRCNDSGEDSENDVCDDSTSSDEGKYLTKTFYDEISGIFMVKILFFNIFSSLF